MNNSPYSTNLFATINNTFFWLERKGYNQNALLRAQK